MHQNMTYRKMLRRPWQAQKELVIQRLGQCVFCPFLVLVFERNFIQAYCLVCFHILPRAIVPFVLISTRKQNNSKGKKTVIYDPLTFIFWQKNHKLQHVSVKSELQTLVFQS